MKLIKKNSKGFSLVELILVLGLSSLIFLGVLSMEKRRTEKLKAESAGQQIEEVGKALSSYIANQRAILSSNIASNTTITLPLTVLQGVTSGVYPGKQYLPTSFNSQNAFGTGYRLQIRNNGGDALTGIVITDAAVVDETGSIRYDWLGYAARVAGAQSGMSFFTGSQVTGLNAGWTIPNTQFTSITTAGQLAYRSQYQGNFDDIYLRRDGLYPMTGDLNMGNHNIRDATDINFNGFLNGNNALLNNLQSGYIANSGNIDNAGNITNQNDIRTLTVRGLAQAAGIPGPGANGPDYSAFSNTYTTYSNNTSYINRDQSNGYTDVTIGNGNNGLLNVRDIKLGVGVNGRNFSNKYLSDLLPRYSSRGIYVVGVPASGVAYLGFPSSSCPTNVAKIELIPQSYYVQSRVEGTIDLMTTPAGGGDLNLYARPSNMYGVGGVTTFAAGGGPWNVYMYTPDYSGSGFVGGTVLAHVYCDNGA
jgi:type II secretory pathway pseudopilin PulG